MLKSEPIDRHMSAVRFSIACDRAAADGRAQVRHLGGVEGERPVGIFSATDALRLAADLLEA